MSDKGSMTDILTRRQQRNARQSASEADVSKFLKGAGYQDGDAPTEKVDKRKKPASEKGKPVTFYLQERYSQDLDKALQDMPRGVSRSDLIKVGIELVKQMTDVELKARINALSHDYGAAEHYILSHLRANAKYERDVLVLFYISEMTQHTRDALEGLDEAHRQNFDDRMSGEISGVITKDLGPDAAALRDAHDKEVESARAEFLEAWERLGLPPEGIVEAD